MNTFAETEVRSDVDGIFGEKADERRRAIPIPGNFLREEIFPVKPKQTETATTMSATKKRPREEPCATLAPRLEESAEASKKKRRATESHEGDVPQPVAEHGDAEEPCLTGGFPAEQNMNSLNTDVRRAIAYFLDMRSLAAMSLVDHAWYESLSDRRVRNRTRVRCIEEGLPALVWLDPRYTAGDTEHWYHLVAIGHEVRLVKQSLMNGYCYLSRLFTKANPVFKAWKALESKFETVRCDFDSWACNLYPMHVPKYAKLWPQRLMYLPNDRVDPAIEHFADLDFLGLFERYGDLDRCVVTEPHRCMRKKNHRRGFFDDELRACAAFVAFLRKSLRLWQLYFAMVDSTFTPYYWRTRESLDRVLPSTIERLETAIDGTRI